MMSAAQGRRERKRLWQEINREARKRARAELRALRDALKDARAAKRLGMADVRQRCRTDRKALRVRVAELRAVARAELKEAVRLEKTTAAARCDAAKTRAGELRTTLEQQRAALAAERQYRAELRQIGKSQAQRKKEHRGASSAERRSESDDEVRMNLTPDMAQVFDRVRGQIRGSDRQTRTEAFLKWAEEHPAEVLRGLEDSAEKRVRELEAEERQLSKALRRPARATPPADFDVAEGESFSEWLATA
jgi:hypothetical protein